MQKGEGSRGARRRAMTGVRVSLLVSDACPLPTRAQHLYASETRDGLFREQHPPTPVESLHIHPCSNSSRGGLARRRRPTGRAGRAAARASHPAGPADPRMSALGPMSLLLGGLRWRPSGSAPQCRLLRSSQRAALHLGVCTSRAIFTFESPRHNTVRLRPEGASDGSHGHSFAPAIANSSVRYALWCPGQDSKSVLGCIKRCAKCHFDVL